MVLSPILVVTRGFRPVGTCPELYNPVTQEVKLQKGAQEKEEETSEDDPLHIQTEVPASFETLGDPGYHSGVRSGGLCQLTSRAALVSQRTPRALGSWIMSQTADL